MFQEVPDAPPPAKMKVGAIELPDDATLESCQPGWVDSYPDNRRHRPLWHVSPLREMARQMAREAREADTASSRFALTGATWSGVICWRPLCPKRMIPITRFSSNILCITIPSPP